MATCHECKGHSIATSIGSRQVLKLFLSDLFGPRKGASISVGAPARKFQGRLQRHCHREVTSCNVIHQKRPCCDLCRQGVCLTHRKSKLGDCNGKKTSSLLFLCSLLRLLNLAFRITKTHLITSSAQLCRCFLELAWHTQIVVC